MNTQIKQKTDKEELLKELKIIKAQLAVLEESEIKRKKAEEEVLLLQTLTLSICNSPDFVSALKTALTKICEIAKWDFGQAWIPNVNGSVLECADAWYSSKSNLEKFREISLQLEFQKDIGFLGKCWSSKCPLWINDVTSSPSCLRSSLAKTLGLKSGLFLPIVVNDEVISVIEFFILEEKKEDTRFVNIVSTVATQLGLLIQSKKFEETLTRSKKYLKKQNVVLKRIATCSESLNWDLKNILKEITESVSQTLNVERSSVWLFSDDKSKLVNHELYELSTNKHSETGELFSRDYPKYFTALKNERVIDASYAHTDERTSELSSRYLTPLGIRSMLDAPIIAGGEMIGVFCIGHVGSSRIWTTEEINFAGSIADAISIVYESYKRKAVEKTLNEAQSNFKSLVNSIDGLIWEVSLKPQKLIFVSKKAEDMLGYTVKEWLSKPKFWKEHLYPDDKEMAANTFKKAIREGKGYELEYRMLSKDGKIVWIKEIASVIKENNTPVKICGVSIDVTNTKQSVLLDELKLFRNLMDDSMDAVFIVDPETGKFLDVNETACRSLGYMRDELLNMAVKDIELIIPDDSEWKKAKEDVKQQGSKIVEGFHKRKDKFIFPVEVNVKYTTHGEKEYFIAFVRNISERKKNEEVEARLSSIVDFSADGIIGTDTNGIIFSWNKGAEKMYGYTKEEIVGKSVSLLMLAESERKEIIKKILQGELITHHEAERIRKDGRRIYVSSDICPIKNINGEITGISAVVRDITEKKIREEKLKETQRRLTLLIDTIPGIVYRCKNDKDWTMEYINGACLQITGYKPEDLISGKVTYNSLIIPEDREMVWNTVQKAIQKKEPFVMEYRLKTKSEEVKWIWEKGYGVFSSDGSLIALEGLTNDITENKKLQEELELAKQKDKQEKEITGLQKLADSKEGDIMSQLFGFTSLSQSLPHIFDEFTRRYNKLIDLALEKNNEATHNIPDELRFIAKQLGFLKAASSDILDIHTTTLKKKCSSEKTEKTDEITEISRKMLLELMGHLASYYRNSVINNKKSSLLENSKSKKKEF